MRTLAIVPVDPKRGSTAWLCAVLGVAFLATQAEAQIVSDVMGVTDLRLYNFYGDPSPDQIEVSAIGLNDVNPSIDGTGFFGAGGLSEIYYNVLSTGPAQTILHVNAIAETLDAAGGGGGRALLDVAVHVSAPFYYRLEANETDGSPQGYAVTFNGTTGSASYSPFGDYEGTFPLAYEPNNPLPVGWDTYIDEGFLPAGPYTFSVMAASALDRYANHRNSSGTATLLIQLQGDANLDGFVGIEDLNVVLSNWNDQVPTGLVQFGDLSRDGFVGIEDLNQVLSSWNVDVRPPAAVVPEPGAFGVIALGLSAALWHRDRISRRLQGMTS